MPDAIVLLRSQPIGSGRAARCAPVFRYSKNMYLSPRLKMTKNDNANQVENLLQIRTHPL